MTDTIGPSTPGEGEFALPTRTCLRCNYVWTPRLTRRPQVCPRCKSYTWDRPRRGRGRTLGWVYTRVVTPEETGHE